MKIPTTVGLALALALTSTQPVAAAETSAVEVKVKDFRTLDVDRDGRVSGGEAQSENTLSETFRQADANGDGFLTEKEYATWLQGLKATARGHNPPAP